MRRNETEVKSRSEKDDGPEVRLRRMPAEYLIVLEGTMNVQDVKICKDYGGDTNMVASTLSRGVETLSERTTIGEDKLVREEV